MQFVSVILFGSSAANLAVSNGKKSMLLLVLLLFSDCHSELIEKYYK